MGPTPTYMYSLNLSFYLCFIIKIWVPKLWDEYHTMTSDRVSELSTSSSTTVFSTDPRQQGLCPRPQMSHWRWSGFTPTWGHVHHWPRTLPPVEPPPPHPSPPLHYDPHLNPPLRRWLLTTHPPPLRHVGSPHHHPALMWSQPLVNLCPQIPYRCV